MQTATKDKRQLFWSLYILAPHKGQMSQQTRWTGLYYESVENCYDFRNWRRANWILHTRFVAVCTDKDGTVLGCRAVKWSPDLKSLSQIKHGIRELEKILS